MLNWPQKAAVALLEYGVHDSHNATNRQRIVVANFFSIIGYSITFLMSISAFVNDNHALGISLFIAACIFAFAHFLNGFVKHENSYKWSANIVQTCLIVLMLYLVYSGGKNNTGPLWIYIVPPVVFFFGGLKLGGTYLFLFLTVVGMMLFYPADSFLATSYTFDFASRILFSFLTVSLLFGFYEYSRQLAIRHTQQLSDKFEKQAMTDPLTKAPNRRGMKEHLLHEYARSKRSGRNACILLCDIDYFKEINDKFGHDGGDHALVELTKLLKMNLREQDKLARWGGEEFLILLPETAQKQAYALAERLRAAIDNSPVSYNTKQIHMSMSVGLAILDPEQSVDNAINEADKKLYKAKEAGRNKVL